MKLDNEVAYTFLSPGTVKMRDSAFIVHETIEAPPGTHYRRRTVCKRENWHDVEPLVPVLSERETTCIWCLSGLAK